MNVLLRNSIQRSEKKEHITVEASSQGSINDLEKNVLDAAKGRVGALAMPNIFSAYADTAYTLEQMGQVVDLSPYLTEKEKAAYLPNYLEEGDFSDDGSIHIILTTSTKFLRIMEMASIELGGYEMRFDLNTVYVTKNFFPMLNLPSEDVSGLSTRYFQQMLREFDQTHSHTVWVGHSKVYEISFSDGTIRYIRMETSREGYAQIGLVEDFTSVMLERQRIEHERDYDALTGLYNRRAFQRESEALFEHSEVLGHAALLMIDLDNLKRTNDTFGHDWGDAYIRQAGQCFISSVPVFPAMNLIFCSTATNRRKKFEHFCRIFPLRFQIQPWSCQVVVNCPFAFPAEFPGIRKTVQICLR